ncbi:protein singed wings 2-like [Ostrinia furnacalis]|uniref:protein singed wings 2-like n=1 Tax=Ostrinia furnacalis TaxID=93504 RepID=UPI001040B36C|nr:protein singed wings 2-like [Ostrinia furnacalis]
MKVPAQVILFLSAVSVVTPGNWHRRNTTGSLNKHCSLVDHSLSTQCVQTQYRLLCRGGLTREWMRQVKHDISHLRVLDCPGPCVNITRIQQQFPELRILELINCTSLYTFKGHFGTLSKIKELVIRGSPSLWEMPAGVIIHMPELRVLDLRGNGIRHMREDLLSGPPALERVHLSDNQWDCSDGGLDWLAMQDEHSAARKRIVDYEQLVCHQQLYRGKPLHKVMDIIKTMHQTCPEPCTCTMTHVVSDAAGAVIPLITVNCASKQLAAPPASLPPNTTTLRLEGNKINTIRSIVQNPQYRKLADLVLDNNSISAVKELEGSEWFTTFRVLSLRGNLLKQVQYETI